MGKDLKVDRYGKTRNPVLTTQWHGLKFWMPPPSQNRRQAIILTDVRLLSIGILGTNFSEILIKIQNFLFTKMHLKISSVKWGSF